MKNLLSLTLVIIVCNLIQGCSTDFEDPEPPVRTQYKLTVTVGEGGSVSPDANGTYNEGVAITITATPDEGYKFDRWEGSNSDGCHKLVTSTSNVQPDFCRTAILMDSDRDVIAFFKIK
jgi:hypothetical protein